MSGKASLSRHSRQKTYIRYTTLKRSKRSLFMMVVVVATVIVYVTARLLVRRPLHVLVRFSDPHDEIHEGFSVLVPKDAFTDQRNKFQRPKAYEDTVGIELTGKSPIPQKPSKMIPVNNDVMSKARSPKWKLNPINKCKNSSPHLLIMITSHESMTSSRDIIRKTWCKGNRHTNEGGVVCIFLVGQDEEVEGTSSDVTEEYITNRDIIKQSFSDTFRNSSRKLLMGMEWMKEYCPDAKYVMKVEDDVIVNTDVIMKRLLEAADTKNYFAGKCWSDAPNRNPKSRFYVSKHEYPEEQYPLYCSRTGYIMSGDVMKRMHEAASVQKYIALDDVFTGVLLRKIGVTPVDTPGFLLGTFDDDVECTNVSSAATLHAHGMDVEDVWEQIQANCKR